MATVSDFVEPWTHRGPVTARARGPCSRGMAEEGRQLQGHGGGYSRPPSHMQAGNGHYSRPPSHMQAGNGHYSRPPSHMQPGNGQYSRPPLHMQPGNGQYSRPPSHMQPGNGHYSRPPSNLRGNQYGGNYAPPPSTAQQAIAPTITISNKTTTGTTTPDHLQTPNQAITMTVTAGTLDQPSQFRGDGYNGGFSRPPSHIEVPQSQPHRRLETPMYQNTSTPTPNAPLKQNHPGRSIIGANGIQDHKLYKSATRKMTNAQVRKGHMFATSGIEPDIELNYSPRTVSKLVGSHHKAPRYP